MPIRAGFDNDKYLKEQETAILERVARLGLNLTSDPNFAGKNLFIA